MKHKVLRILLTLVIFSTAVLGDSEDEDNLIEFPAQPSFSSVEMPQGSFKPTGVIVDEALGDASNINTLIPALDAEAPQEYSPPTHDETDVNEAENPGLINVFNVALSPMEYDNFANKENATVTDTENANDTDSEITGTDSESTGTDSESTGTDSESTGTDSEYPTVTDSEYPTVTDSEYPTVTDSEYPTVTDSEYPIDTDSEYPIDTDSEYPIDTDSDNATDTDTENATIADTENATVTERENYPAAHLPDSSIFKGFLDSPIAQLFSGEDYTGNYEMYTYEKSTYENGCHNLSSLVGNVKSVDTYGKCVRLFKGRNCEGWSQAVYPGSGNSQKVLSSKLTRVISIGPCLPDEFQSATVSEINKEAMVVKNHTDWKSTVPDLVEFLSYDKYWQSISNVDSLVYYSPKGHLNRSEFLLAHIYQKHLERSKLRTVHLSSGGRPYFIISRRITHHHLTDSQPTVNMEDTEYYKSLDKQAGDVLGYGIPISLGGPVKKNNIFPQTPVGKEQWIQLTSGIRPYLEQKSGFVDLGLNFMYADGVATRPYVFYYWMKFGTTRIFYGRVLN